MYGAVTKDKFFGRSLKHFGHSDYVGVHYGGAAFFQITICSQGNVKLMSHLLLCESFGFPYFPDIVFYGRVVHCPLVLVGGKIMP